MKTLFKYPGKLEINLIQLADYSGVLASCLCFVHCWILPGLLVFAPGLLPDSEFAHPMLCGIALLSTAPMLFRKAYRLQRPLSQIALIIGNALMLVIICTHGYLLPAVEVVVTTLGGVCLLYVHLPRSIKHRS